MPQIHVFQCPSCGANLSYDGGPETSFPCQFCGTSVIVPEELRPHSAAQPGPQMSGGGMVDLGAIGQLAAAGGMPLEKLAEMKRLAQSGQKIEAIRLYREIFGVGLREAKEAVEKLEAGQPLVIAGTSVDVTGDAAAWLARELESAGMPSTVQTAEALGADVARPRATAALAPARPKRGSSVLGCAVVGCFGVLLLGVVGISLVMTSGGPLSVSGLYKQLVEATAASTDVLPTRAPNATRVPNATPPLSAPQVDATLGSKLRSTEQARSTAAAQATATRAAVRAATTTALAEATGQAAEAAAAQAQAEATAQAMIAAQAAWPAVVTESFANNQLGWPTGPSEDDYFAITTTVKAKKYVWSFVPKREAYANAFPLNPKPYGDFTAAVKLKFVQGGGDGNIAAGLVFRHADQDYGFFGIDPSGHYRITLAFSGAQDYQEDQATAIHTGVGQVNQLTVRSLGSDLVFAVNDQVVWQLAQDLPSGDFGLGVDAKNQGDPVSVEFTEFAVHAPKK